MQHGQYPEVPDDFGHWLAGLIDGEGCFVIERQKRHYCPNYRCRLELVLRADDGDIIEEIRRNTGCGYRGSRPAYASTGGYVCNPAVIWTVGSQPDCLRIIELFDAHPLRAKKARDYAIWREAVGLWTQMRMGPGGSRTNAPLRDRMAEFKSALSEGRGYQGSVLTPKIVEHDSITAGDDVALF